MGSMAYTHPRGKVHAVVDRISRRYHFAPLDEGPASSGKPLHRNLVLMVLTHLLDRNHLLLGEPGSGKTTAAKIIAATLSGLPYDLYDALEIRGNPQKFEEKVVARPDYGSLARGEESVVWQGTFGLDVLVGDELNRLPLDTQDVILQGIDTSRWNYLNRSLFEGKKPGFFTMNEKDGDRENGLLPALRDRLDVVTEEQFFTTMIAFDLAEAKRAVEADLGNGEFTQGALDALARGYEEYKKVLTGKRPIEGHLTREEKAQIQQEIAALELDNDAMLFLQAFMAEINYSAQYGSKRSADQKKVDATHDHNYAGIEVNHSFSPRSVMAAMDYTKALAWFLNETPTIDHVRFVLPYLFAHKAGFHDDYVNKHGNDERTDCQTIHLAQTLVGEVHTRYTGSIQLMKNFIAVIQDSMANGVTLTEDAAKAAGGSLDETKHDHPLMKDLVRTYKQGEKRAFYASEED